MAEMSKNLSLILETLSGMRLDIDFPADMTARELSGDIASQLEYPVIDADTNELIDYYLADGKGNRIGDDTTFAAAGLSDGDTVKLQSTSKNLALSPTPPRVTPPPDGQIGLWIKLLHMPGKVYEQFDMETTISGLLAQMNAKYDLPVHYPNSNEPIVYVERARLEDGAPRL